MIKFYAPEEVWKRLEDKTITKNGCGSGLSAFFVPDKWLGLDFTIPCGIHDEMYSIGKTYEDKEIADRVFYNNMLRSVESRPKILQPFGRIIAYQYYDKVKKYGATAYWDGKNRPEEMKKAVIETIANGAIKIKGVM